MAVQVSVLVIGLVCVVAAITGGRLKLGGGDIPPLNAWQRWAILAVGAAVVVLSFVVNTGPSEQPSAKASAQSTPTTTDLTPPTSGPISTSVPPAPGTPPPESRFTLAPAPSGEASISLSPTSGTGGTRITVRGTNYAPGEGVEVYFQGQLLANTSADSSGSFSVVISVPGSDGEFHGVALTVSASGRSSVRSADAPFTIT